MRSLMAAVLGGILLVSIVMLPAFASTGGPDLAEPLGWNPESGEVFFRIVHGDESGDAPSVVRLTLGQRSNQFEPLSWSVGVERDSVYRAELNRIRKTLHPLHEMLWTTIPAMQQALTLETLKADRNAFPRYRVRVSGFNGACRGWVEAETFRDPVLRMVRLYRVPGRRDLIGVFSFRGTPTEMAYETQVPVLLPQDKESVIRIKRVSRLGSPRSCR